LGLVVGVLPARTDTRWFYDYCIMWHLRFIKGRLKFGGKGSAPFPSIVVVFSAKYRYFDFSFIEKEEI